MSMLQFRSQSVENVCGECLLQEGSRDTTCMLCEQVDDLLSMVVKLEKVKKLRSIRECK